MSSLVIQSRHGSETFQLQINDQVRISNSITSLIYFKSDAVVEVAKLNAPQPIDWLVTLERVTSTKRSHKQKTFCAVCIVTRRRREG